MKDVNLLINNGTNVNQALELFGDMDTYNETLETFLVDAEKKLADIKRFKEVADMANYSILVHSLKSDAKYFGFERLATLAYQHELESKANNIYYVYDKYDELFAEGSRIIMLVKQYLGQSGSAAPSAGAIQAPVPKDKNILVVDDSDIIRNFVTKLFNDEYGVLIASDGGEAIRIISDTSQNRIVAMLLDLNMPTLDGFSVLEFMNRNNLFTKIPVSIITGEGSMDTISRALQYPVADVLRKPFNERDVKSVIEKTIAINNE